MRTSCCANIRALSQQFALPADPVDRYDGILVPRVFEPWARTLLDAVELGAGQTLLDVASGPGTVAHLAAARLGRGGRVVALDVSRPMLDRARSKPSARGWYVQSLAAPLPVRDQVADVIMCQQGLQFFPDCRAVAAEMRRVLKPQGRLVVATWAENGPIPLGVLGTKLREYGIQNPVPPPFGRALDEVVNLLKEADFSILQAEQRSLPIEWEGGIDQMMEVAVPATVGPLLDQLSAEQRKEVLAAAREEMLGYVEGPAARYPSVANMVVAGV